VVFTRIKSLGALKGMGNNNRSIWCFRMRQWELVDTFDLLPGDLISLTKGTKTSGGGSETTSSDNDKRTLVQQRKRKRRQRLQAP